MSQLPHLLLVDDEREIRDPLAAYLSRNGMRVTKADNAATARQMLDVHAIDLILLDIMMPGEDGLSLAGSVRATSQVPIILLTARVEDRDRIAGLELGADDYVAKPFNPRELLARIRSVLRRTQAGGRDSQPSDVSSFAFGDWELRSGNRELVDRNGVGHPLSTGEYSLLLALVTHPRQVLTRDQLLDLSRGRQLGPFDRSVDNQISRIRKKVEADPANPVLIKTVRGGGYMLASDVARR